MTNENANNDDLLTNAGFIECQAALSKALDIFVEATKKAVNPEIFDPKARWAVEHDKTCDYHTHTVLNRYNKYMLDLVYEALVSPESDSRRLLHAIQESTPTNEDERKIKNKGTAYIGTWLEHVRVFYTNFLAGVTIDREDFQDKYVRVRGELIDQTNKVIIHDYVDYMKEHEEWGSEDVERFLAGDALAEVPESFSQSYYADLDLLD